MCPSENLCDSIVSYPQNIVITQLLPYDFSSTQSTHLDPQICSATAADHSSIFVSCKHKTNYLMVFTFFFGSLSSRTFQLIPSLRSFTRPTQICFINSDAASKPPPLFNQSESSIIIFTNV